MNEILICFLCKKEIDNSYYDDDDNLVEDDDGFIFVDNYTGNLEDICKDCFKNMLRKTK